MSDLLPGRSAPRSRAVTGKPKSPDRPAYAFEQEVEHQLYLHPLQASIARGTIRTIDSSEAEATEGVVTVLTHENAPRLASDDDRELSLQDPEVSFRGQLIGAVIADSSEAAREAAAGVRVSYDPAAARCVLRPDHPDLLRAREGQPRALPTDTQRG